LAQWQQIPWPSLGRWFRVWRVQPGEVIANRTFIFLRSNWAYFKTILL
jgi:hypothetical protein